MVVEAGTPFNILVVCTGNICRSPLAERLLTAEFARLGLGENQVRVESAGVAALVGQPMTEQAAAQASLYGGNPTGHHARQLVAEMVERADLILTMERRHRAEVVRLVARASRYAFTLPEFARLTASLLAAELDIQLPTHSGFADQLRALVPEIAAERGLALPLAEGDDEVEDPYRRSDAVYARSANQIAAAVSSMMGSMMGLGLVRRV